MCEQILIISVNQQHSAHNDVYIFLESVHFTLEIQMHIYFQNKKQLTKRKRRPRESIVPSEDALIRKNGFDLEDTICPLESSFMPPL